MAKLPAGAGKPTRGTPKRAVSPKGPQAPRTGTKGVPVRGTGRPAPKGPSR